MKNFTIILTCSFFFCFGCSKSTVTGTNPSSSDTCHLTVNTDKKISFLLDGFGLTNSLVDFAIHGDTDITGNHENRIDTVIYATELVYPEDSSFYLEQRAFFVKIGNIGYEVSLRISVPKIVSGEYIWEVHRRAAKPVSHSFSLILLNISLFPEKRISRSLKKNSRVYLIVFSDHFVVYFRMQEAILGP